MTFITSLTSIHRILANVDIKTGIQLCQVKVEIEKEYMQSDVIMVFLLLLIINISLAQHCIDIY